MDSTLLSGITTSLATLVGALIGATATVKAALMSKTYADKQISWSKTSDEMKPLIRGIIQFSSLFRVDNHYCFIAQEQLVHDKMREFLLEPIPLGRTLSAIMTQADK